MSREARRAGALMAAGERARARGDLQRARNSYEAALALRRTLYGQEHVRVANSLEKLATTLDDLGEYGTAEAHHSQALAIRRSLFGDEHVSVAASWHGLARALWHAGDAVQARQHFEAALSIRRRALGDVHPDVAASLNGIGAVAHWVGNYSDARTSFEQALTIFEATLGPDHALVAGTLNNLGLIAGKAGDYASARTFYNRAADLWHRRHGEANADILNNLANLASDLGDPAASARHHEQALEIRRRKLGEAHPDVALSLNNLGVVATDRGDAEAARGFHAESLAIRRQALGELHPDVAMSLHNLGNVSADLGDAEAAETYLREALSIRRRTLGPEHYFICSSLLSLGRIRRERGDLAAAETATVEAFAIAVSPENGAMLPSVYDELSRVRDAEGFAEAAIFFGKQAVNAIQRQRGRLAALDAELQRSFLATKEQVYRDLADRLVTAGRLGEAQQVLVMLKEEELFDLLRRDAGSDPRLSYTQLTSLEAEWQRHGDDLGQDLVRLTGEIAALRALAPRSDADEARLRAARADLDAAGRAFRGWLDTLRGSLAAAAGQDAHKLVNLDYLEILQGDLRALGPGVALVSYVVGQDKLSIILTTVALQVSRDVAIGERTVNKLVHEFRRALDGRLDEEARQLGHSLWRHLIAPVDRLLAESAVTTLMVVPYGTLRYLPMAALHDGTRYLVERFAVSVLTLAAQGALRDRPDADWQLAGLGVSRAVPGYRRLLAVAAELEGIVRTAPEAAGVYPGVIRLDEAFTEEAFAGSLEAHQAVHVASHFVLNPAQGFHSHLLLGDGTTLSLDRLRDVRFDFHSIELITLSACETAMGGGGENGQEFEGFAALVQRRGAKAVVASLWPVADDSTAALMHAFYRTRRDGASKAEALRQAQLHLIAGPHAHPYFWAPFILMGNWL